MPAPDSFQALRDLVGFVGRENAFYSRKWVTVDLSTPPTSPEDFANRFPLTTKAELVADQLALPPYGSVPTFPVDRYIRCHQTSGTTGTPLRWLDTAADWSALTDDWVHVLHAAGVRASDRVFVPFSFGPFLGFWLAFEAAQRLGCLTLPGGGMSTPLRARVLLENQCTILCGTPTYLLHLANAARSHGIDVGSGHVRLLIVAGEPGGNLPAVRAQLGTAWPGARVFDHHGMTEVGPVTYEHPERPGDLVVIGRSFWAEVLEPEGTTEVPEGTVGELVLTTLRRPGSPLVRYRTGDLVRPRRIPTAGTLEAGDTALALEGGILGRTDDMVIVRGINLYPSAVDELVHRFPDIQEYRVTLDLRGLLPEVSIEVEAEASTASALADTLQQNLALRIPVASVPPETLPRFELKARRWRRLGVVS